MADYPATVADTLEWKAAPVPSEDVIAQCQGRPVRITVRASLTDAYGITLNPGQAVKITSGQAAFVRPGDAGLGGVLVVEVLS